MCRHDTILTSDIFNKPGTEVSAESLKKTEAAETSETTRSLESQETSADPGMGNQTTWSPGR